MTKPLFLEVISEAAHDASQIIERCTQSSDYPVLVVVPETLHLKVRRPARR